MSLFRTSILSAMLVICLLATAGCMGISGPACQQQPGAEVNYPALSFSATPVQ
jgi:hypothetical protein